jgi:ubiquinone/menaquinone biosynthesis C-methylase UbiE
MRNKGKPASLEGRWDILYRDYPAVYDEFASIPMLPDDIEIIAEKFSLALENLRNIGHQHIHFCQGDAERLPLGADSVDMAVGITLAGCDVRRAALEMARVVCPGGIVLRVDVAPGWYGGELNPVITGQPRDESPHKGTRDAILDSMGYEALDIYKQQDFGTVERAVRTYGFIHSERVIDHLRRHDQTVIRWKFRMRYKVIS